MMNRYGALSVLALFLALGGNIVYSNISKQHNDTIVVTELPQSENRAYMVSKDTQETIEVDMYYYAAETHDGVLIPLAFASQVITDEDEDQFVLLTETIFPQIDFDEIDKGTEMLMLHINKNRTLPVYVEVIRVSD